MDGSLRPLLGSSKLRSLEDDVFRQRLLSEPRATVEQELGTRLPEWVRMEAVDTIYLMLPSASVAGVEGGVLSHRDLESVAGGLGSDDYTGSLATCDWEAACMEVIDE